MTSHGTLADTMVGATLAATYQIERVVGEGGMGTVYEALHLRLNKHVAVKVMAHALATNAEALARFRREAEVTSAIGHPHIVQVMDFATAATGEPFFVMEFLDGEDLEHRMQRQGRLPCLQTLHIVKQVASALAAAHAKGVVHRDLKPANIYLLDVPGERDFVKVLDFGVSKVHAAATKLTAGSRLMGTPKYMSREQAQGLTDEVDDRTDQWALACIAWEALVGRAPFVADDDLSVLYQVVYETPPSFATKALPPQVDRVLRRALAKDRRERFPSISEFARAFERAIVKPTTESRSKRRHGSTWFAGGPRPLPTLRLAFPTPLALQGHRQGSETSLLASGAAGRPLSAKRSHSKWFWPLAALLAASVASGASPLLQAVSASAVGDGAVVQASARPPILLPEAITTRPAWPADGGPPVRPGDSDETVEPSVPAPSSVPGVALGREERMLPSAPRPMPPAQRGPSRHRRPTREAMREPAMGPAREATAGVRAPARAMDRSDGAVKATLIREL